MTVLGMGFGLLAAFLWAFESVFIKLGMDTKGAKFTNKEIVLTRSIFTTVSTWIIIMPVMLFVPNTVGGPFYHFGQIFSHWDSGLTMLSIAVNILILRYLHVLALEQIGPKLTAIIDTNNFLIPAVFAEVLQFLPNGKDGRSNGFDVIPWWSFLLLIPLLIGVYLVLVFHKNKEDDSLLDKKME